MQQLRKKFISELRMIVVKAVTQLLKVFFLDFWNFKDKRTQEESAKTQTIRVSMTTKYSLPQKKTKHHN